MILMLIILCIAVLMLLWFVEVKIGEKALMGKNAGARVTGGLFSMSASGTVGKALTYGKWKGRQWCRVHFVPQNPKTAGQTNVRLALALLVAAWQGESDAGKLRWDNFANQFNMSGFNQYVRRGMLEYIVQITSAVTPVSVTDDKVGPPGEAWTWT